MKKEVLQIIIKVAIYALGLVAAYFGVSSMTSCTTSHGVQSYGKTTIVTTDTTFIKHDGFIRSKKYHPYEQNY
jgi:hypothetical protein